MSRSKARVAEAYWSSGWSTAAWIVPLRLFAKATLSPAFEVIKVRAQAAGLRDQLVEVGFRETSAVHRGGASLRGARPDELPRVRHQARAFLKRAQDGVHQVIRVQIRVEDERALVPDMGAQILDVGEQLLEFRIADFRREFRNLCFQVLPRRAENAQSLGGIHPVADPGIHLAQGVDQAIDVGLAGRIVLHGKWFFLEVGAGQGTCLRQYFVKGVQGGEVIDSVDFQLGSVDLILDPGVKEIQDEPEWQREEQADQCELLRESQQIEQANGRGKPCSRYPASGHLRGESSSRRTGKQGLHRAEAVGGRKRNRLLRPASRAGPGRHENRIDAGWNRVDIRRMIRRVLLTLVALCSLASAQAGKDRIRPGRGPFCSRPPRLPKSFQISLEDVPAPAVAPTPEEPKRTPDEIVGTFFEALKADHVNTAYDTLKSEFAMSDRGEDEAKGMRAQTQKALDAYGPVLSYELVHEEKLGTHLLRRTYLLAGQTLPLRWKFYFYKAGRPLESDRPAHRRRDRGVVRRPTCQTRQMTVLAPAARFLQFVRFSHTIFAMPFALGAMFVAADGLPSARTFSLVVLAMVFARTAAMTFNRVADWEIDQRNPRTDGRHRLASRGEAIAGCVVS